MFCELTAGAKQWNLAEQIIELLHIDCTDEIPGAACRLLQARQMNRGL